MPNLPKPRLRRTARTRGGVVTRPSEPERPNVEVVEFASDGAPALRWINIERPRPADRAWLEEHFDFHPLDYEDVFSRNQRPKVDEYDDYLFIVLHFPAYDKTVGRLNAAELDVFVGPDYVITLPNEPIQPLEYLFERCRTREDLREQLFSKGPGYLLYKIVDDCVDASFPMLRKMGNKLERLEDDIFEGERSAEIVRDISNVKQEIINFRRVVRPQRAALKDLEATKRYIPDDLEIYFDDINDASERIWDMLENYKEVVEALESTNEAVLSHRLNDTFRVLTAISVIVLPLTLIASIWGMNTGRPGRGLARRLLRRRRRHGHRPRGDDRALQAPRLALTAYQRATRHASMRGMTTRSRRQAAHPRGGRRRPGAGGDRRARRSAPATTARDTCLNGYVWREAVPDRSRVRHAAGAHADRAGERRRRPLHRSPTGGAYGPDTCVNGYVWRAAVPGDRSASRRRGASRRATTTPRRRRGATRCTSGSRSTARPSSRARAIRVRAAPTMRSAIRVRADHLNVGTATVILRAHRHRRDEDLARAGRPRTRARPAACSSSPAAMLRCSGAANAYFAVRDPVSLRWSARVPRADGLRHATEGGPLGAPPALREGGRRRSAMPGSSSSGEEWRCLGNDAAAGLGRCRVWRRARLCRVWRGAIRMPSGRGRANAARRCAGGAGNPTCA